MDDREYMEDVDTMTEETGGEALNPDYDRVSGSGEMPSLDEFLGVNRASDGLGNTSDPFGNVIGDPVYSDDSMGGFSSMPGDGFSTSYGTDAGYDDNTTDGNGEDADAEDNEVKVNLKSVMSGAYPRTWFSKNRLFVAFLFLLAVGHIANRDYTVRLINDELQLRKDVHQLRAESIEIATKLMNISKVTTVSELVKKRKLGIHKVYVPPMQFVMDKFVRADSLVKDYSEEHSGASYAEGYDFISR